MKSQKCITSNIDKDIECQNISANGYLLNLSIPQLLKTFDNQSKSEAEVYSYVLTTVKTKEKKFCQTGCGPNFEGGVITLCTCKHYMRAYKDPKGWEGVWISGLINYEGKTFLLYLMKIKCAVNNMYDLCESLPEKTRNIKSANNSIFGDVYTPKKILNTDKDKFKIENYNPPIEGHKHFDNYQDDILYFYKSLNRYPSLLVGDPKNSFVWTRPIIEITHPKKKKFGRGCKNWKLEEYTKYLK